MRRPVAVAVTGLLALSLSAGCSSEKNASRQAAELPAKNLSLAEVSTLFDQQLKANKSVQAKLNQKLGSTGQGLTGSMAIRDNGTAEDDLEITATTSTPAGQPPAQGQAAQAQQLHVILLKDASYLKSAQETQPGKPWVKIPKDSKSPLAGMMGAMMTMFRRFGDVRQQMTLTGIAGKVTAVKPEKVGTADATRYSIEVDMAQALDKMDIVTFIKTQLPPELAQQMNVDLTKLDSPELRQRVPELKKELKKQYAGVKATTDVWVGNDRRPLRYVFTTTPANGKTPAAGAGGSAGGSTEMTLSNWGKATIHEPPAAQVADISTIQAPGQPGQPGQTPGR